MSLVDRLQKLGVPTAALARGDVLDTTVTVYDVDQLRQLVDLGLDSEGRQAHLDALFDEVEVGADAESRLVHRIERHVIGEDKLAAEDRAAVEPVFPLQVKVFASAEPMTISTPRDFSTPDGRLQVVDISDLTITQGGCVICRSTPLSFTCDTLTRTGNTGSSASDFNILGTVGVKPPTPPQPGAATQAAKGKDGECSSGGIAGTGGQLGTAGATGTPGTPGDRGGNGKPSQQATIVIKSKLTADRLTVFSQSGPGGEGGDGGQGGKGQQGGNGGDGVTCGCTGNGGGPGNNGGQGGPGGPAGPGGDGVDAAGNVVVRVPPDYDPGKIIPLYADAPPGGPGKPGDGGDGGTGGTGGAAGKNNNKGGDGGTNSKGGGGGRGDYGKVTGKPGKITPGRL